ncbi:unnamed protein product, partial [Urochloa humidicola]
PSSLIHRYRSPLARNPTNQKKKKKANPPLPTSRISMAAHGKPKAAGPTPPPPPPPLPEAKKGFMRRMFPFLLAANLFVGAYVFVRTYRKDSEKDSMTDPATTSTSSAGKPAEPVAVPRKELPPIPEDEQRQLYKWMLEEKRKIKPRNAAEKKKLDEEKALLKEFIRAGSLPSL